MPWATHRGDNCKRYLRDAAEGQSAGVIAVIFEVSPGGGRRSEYLEITAALRSLLNGIDGFISIERFQSLADASKILSLSFSRDEAAVAKWRTLEEHRMAQVAGRKRIVSDYRLRMLR